MLSTNFSSSGTWRKVTRFCKKRANMGNKNKTVRTGYRDIEGAIERAK